MKTSTVLVLSAIVALSGGCLSRPLGYSKVEWERMSPAERKRIQDNQEREARMRAGETARATQDTVKAAEAFRLGPTP